MFCVSCGRATPNGATFCPGCGKQSQKKGPFTITCTYCRASNPYDAMFCWYCGRQLPREENIVDFIPFIPSPPLPGGVQPPVGNVPTVQGTPQTSDVPMVQGAPSTLNAPPMGQISSQRAASSSTQIGAKGAASSSAPASAENAALAPGQAGLQGVAPSVGQAVASSGQPAASSASQTAGKQTTPAQSPSPAQPSLSGASSGQAVAPSGQPAASSGHQAAASSAPRTFISRLTAQRMASGGIKVAGHISRRAFMLGLAGGAVAVAAGTGTILYLNRPTSGGSTSGGPTSGGSTSEGPTSGGPSPVQTVTTYNAAVNNKDAQTAWNQLSTHYQSQFGNENSFGRSVVQSSAVTYTLNLEREDSSTATVLETETSSPCPGAQDAILLVIENGVWKIDGRMVVKSSCSS